MLLAHRSLPAGALVTAMQTAVTSGLLNPEVVIIEARRATRSSKAIDTHGAHVSCPGDLVLLHRASRWSEG
ncbi:MAG: hypothetical protein WCG47_26680 [Dermatophilaceae bacterium]